MFYRNRFGNSLLSEEVTVSSKLKKKIEVGMSALKFFSSVITYFVVHEHDVTCTDELSYDLILTCLRHVPVARKYEIHT